MAGWNMQVAAIGPMGAMIFPEYADTCLSQTKHVPMMVSRCSLGDWGGHGGLGVLFRGAEAAIRRRDVRPGASCGTPGASTSTASRTAPCFTQKGWRA